MSLKRWTSLGNPFGRLMAKMGDQDHQHGIMLMGLFLLEQKIRAGVLTDVPKDYQQALRRTYAG
jgi:hypothetical protein